LALAEIRHYWLFHCFTPMLITPLTMPTFRCAFFLSAIEFQADRLAFAIFGFLSLAFHFLLHFISQPISFSDAIFYFQIISPLIYFFAAIAHASIFFLSAPITLSFFAMPLSLLRFSFSRH
jgi:hypothetical protein